MCSPTAGPAMLACNRFKAKRQDIHQAGTTHKSSSCLLNRCAVVISDGVRFGVTIGPTRDETIFRTRNAERFHRFLCLSNSRTCTDTLNSLPLAGPSNNKHEDQPWMQSRNRPYVKDCDQNTFMHDCSAIQVWLKRSTKVWLCRV